MAGVVRAILVILILAVVKEMASSQSNIRWCTVSDAETGKCLDMAGNFTLRRLLPRLECVQARHRYECMRWVKEDKADLVRLDDTELYAAGQYYNLTPVVAEKYNRVPGQDPFRYRAVALIKANGPITSMESLRGRKSCHTGVGKTAGWIVPVSSLVARGLMAAEDCVGSAKAVGSFFSESCSPGALDPTYNPDGDNPANVCALCQNPNTCSEADVYSGYLGAFRCLHEGGGDVAFVTHTTLSDATAYYRNRRLTLPNQDDFRLLCLDGRVDHVDNWANCSWATRPSDTIVTSAAKPSEMTSLYRSILVRAARFFGPGSRDFRMFNSADYGQPNLLFSDRTRVLIGLDPEQGPGQLLDEGYLNTMRNYTNCQTDFRLCVTSEPEEQKCKSMEAAFTAKRLTQNLRCIRTGSTEECLNSLDQNEVDLMSAGSTDVYNGGKYHSSVPIIFESTELNEDSESGYWAVAVVRRNQQNISIDNLRGRTSCHTGIGKSVGWNIPISTLVTKGDITEDPCNIPQDVGNFFSRSCVPGALEEQYNKNGTNPDTMCALCGGVDKCANDNSNQFYSYKGAFRCFIQFNADVAFVSHTTVLKYTDGRSALPWARTRRSRDFELLCQDGTRQPVTNWRSCNLGRVPPHAMLVNSNIPSNIRNYYYSILNSAQLIFGNDTNTRFKLFDSPRESKNLIFKDSTVRLNLLPENEQTYEGFLGEDYSNVLETLDVTQCRSSSGARTVGYLLTLTYTLTLTAVKIFN